MASYSETANALRDELLNTMRVRRELNKDARNVDALDPGELETLARAFAAIHSRNS